MQIKKQGRKEEINKEPPAFQPPALPPAPLVPSTLIPLADEVAPRRCKRGGRGRTEISAFFPRTFPSIMLVRLLATAGDFLVGMPTKFSSTFGFSCVADNAVKAFSEVFPERNLYRKTTTTSVTGLLPSWPKGTAGSVACFHAPLRNCLSITKA